MVPLVSSPSRLLANHSRIVIGSLRCVASAPPQPSGPTFQPDLTFLLSPYSRGPILKNLMRRTGRSSEEAQEMYDQLFEAKQRVARNPNKESRDFLVEAAKKFPNMTHPAVLDLDQPREVYRSEAWKPKFNTERQKVGLLQKHFTS